MAHPVSASPVVPDGRGGDATCAFAHSVNDRGKRHALTDHLEGTAGRAREFGAAFGQGEACYAAGLWHDIGKVSVEFQAYLAACETQVQAPRGRVDHKAAGAVLAASGRGTAHLAQLLLGHHGGIPNIGDASTLCRAARSRPDVVRALGWAQSSIPAVDVPSQISGLGSADRDVMMRLTFSALVDADFLDTEAHFDVERSRSRQLRAPSISDLDQRSDSAHAEFLAQRGDVTRVDGIRAEIRAAALTAAALPPGLFRLTVPTGGGKTRAGLAFALRHARAWDLRRVIVAVPFLTITDQTAAVFRDVLGSDAVLEHHSGIDPQRQDGPHSRLWRRLAAENWDAPVIVTTTVQLFESLFSNRPSHLRKGHRLARSVIILDEAQALPLHVLGVTTDALGALARAAGATIVLCTATQPALEAVDASLSGQLREIVPGFEDHFTALRRRVSFAVPAREGSWSWEQVASEARGARQAMVIVNRRRDAISVLTHLDNHAFHLSTLLCGAHRWHVLDAVRSALADGRPCHLASTQVVEAGVDVDFPLVLRALAPFDSVVQAAGRCNREGRLAEGRCVVFRPEEQDTFGSYRRRTGELDLMLGDGPVDFADPHTCQTYYRHLYGTGSLTDAVVDPQGIRAQINGALFESVASTYRMIDETTIPTVVLYPPERAHVEGLLDAVEQAEQPAQARAIHRQLQPYVVSLRTREIDRARVHGYIDERGGVLVWRGEYDMRTGVAQILDNQPTAGVPIPSTTGGGYVI